MSNLWNSIIGKSQNSNTFEFTNETFRKGILLTGTVGAGVMCLLDHVMLQANIHGMNLVHIILTRSTDYALNFLKSEQYDGSKRANLIIEGLHGIEEIEPDRIDDAIDSLFLLPKVPSDWPEWNDAGWDHVRALVAATRKRWPDRIVVVSHVPFGFDQPTVDNMVVLSRYQADELGSDLPSKMGVVLKTDISRPDQFRVNNNTHDYAIPRNGQKEHGPEYIEKALALVTQDNTRSENVIPLILGFLVYIEGEQRCGRATLSLVFDLMLPEYIHAICNASLASETDMPGWLTEYTKGIGYMTFFREKAEEFARIHGLDTAFLNAPEYRQDEKWTKTVGWVQHSLIPFKNEV